MSLQDSPPGEGDRVLVVTKIRATDVATGLRRIPVGFYVSILIGNEEYRTTNKRVFLESGTIEWTDHFRLPLDPSMTIHLRIYASFELGPMLGRGEILRRHSISVQDVIDLSNESRSIVFVHRGGELVTSCSSLEVKISLLSAVDLSSVVLLPPVAAISDAERFLNLTTDAAHSNMLRYYRDPQKIHLDTAIIQYEKVLDRCPEDYSCRSAALSNLATAKFISHCAGGNHIDLDVPVSLYRQALRLRPNDHPDYAVTLINLASALLFRFNKHGYLADADEAKELLATVLAMCSANSCEHRSALFVVQTSATHNGAGGVVSAPGAASRSPIASISCRSLYSLDQLRHMLQECQQRDDPQLLDSVVLGYHHAEADYVPGEPDWIVLQANLAMALIMRSERKGREQDLHEGIDRNQELLAWISAGHPNRIVLLNNLASSHVTRFRDWGDGNDLDEALQHLREALSLTSTEHPHRAMSLTNTATTLVARFEQRGDRSDLDEAIQHHRAGLSLTPVGHPHRSTSLNNLASALRARFEQQGDPNDLDEVVQYYRDSLSLRPIGHPDHPASLNNITTALRVRFEHQGNRDDLDEAIQQNRNALSLTPIEHRLRSAFLNNLATGLRRRFEQQGDPNDLDEAIQQNRDALLLTPIGHPQRSTSLDNLGTALRIRFEHHGDHSDLDEAIKHHRNSIWLTSAGLPHRSISLTNLATALMMRLKQQGDHNDLNEAIRRYRDGLALTPIGHPQRSASLNNLANALMKRFEKQEDCNDLNEAIQHNRDALSLTPIGHPTRSASLTNLASALTTRFEYQASDTDAVETLQLCRTAETEIPSIHPGRLRVCRTFADIHLALWQTTHIEMHLDSAMAYYRAAVDVEPAGLQSRLRSCLAWVQNAEDLGHESAPEAYARSLQLLDAHVSATASVSDRHVTMKRFPISLSVDAASCALRRGDVPRALELLEQGRAVLWNQLIRFRTSLDDLRARDARAESLVKRFQELSFQLNRQPIDELGKSTAHLSKTAVEAEARHYRHLVEDWNKVVAEIRMVDGFSRFLLPPLFSDLQEAASEGPVAVLVASKFSCDAIIVLHNQPPVHVLLDTTLQRLTELADKLRKQTYLSKDIQRSPVDVLRQLWDSVMLPVVSKLEELVERGSRIWWCPTSIFTAFPLHAVGEYRKTSKRSVAAYISSYTPSLSALIKARKTKLASSPVRFAAIGQALPGGHQVPLQSVDLEVDEIGRLLPSSSTVFTKLPSAESTKQRALHTLQNNPWVHFACHGTQDFNEPFKSHLAMLDGHLSLLDIINSDLSKHEFAFLSACKTAVGDFETLDEVIHLAAGLQFMGVKSVIGTLWSVRDDVAYRLVTKFYERFCSGGKMDPSRAARALHQAVLSLARDKVPLEERMLFIHIGV